MPLSLVRQDQPSTVAQPLSPVVRHRVLDLLKRGEQANVTLISAPAGYGKSIALKHYLDGLGEDAVLVRCEPLRDTSFRFVRDLVEPIAKRHPALMRTMGGALGKARRSDSPARDLATWLQSHLDVSPLTAIVVDDLHYALEDPFTADFLRHAVVATRGTVRWVLATRVSTDLPVSSWLAYGDMFLPITEDDLKFTLDEVRLCAERAGFGLDDHAISSILGLADGWPTSITYALWASTRSLDSNYVAAAAREMAHGYLSEQVFDCLGDDERDVLFALSLVPSGNARYLEAFGISDAPRKIADIGERIPFVQIVADGLRLHDLFKEFIHRRIEMLDAGGREHLMIRAAKALELIGEPLSALGIYRSANDEASVLRILECHGFKMLECGQYATIEKAVKALPIGVQRSNACVLGLRAFIEEESGGFDQAEKHYRQAIACASDVRIRSLLSRKLGLLCNNRGRRVDVSLLRGTLDESDDHEKCETFGVLGIILATQGSIAESQSCVASALDISECIDDDELSARTAYRAGYVALFAGDHDGADRYCHEAVRISNTLGDFYTSFRAYGVLYANALARGEDQSNALWFSQQAMLAAEKNGDMQSRAMWIVAQYEIEVERGRSERAANLEKELATPSTHQGYRDTLPAYKARAIKASWSGDFSEAVRILSFVGPFIAERLEQRVWHALSAFFLACDDQRDRAISHLDAAVLGLQDERIGSFIEEWHLVETRAFCALANFALGRNVVGKRLLQGGKPRLNRERFLLESARSLCDMGNHAISMTTMKPSLEALRANGLGGYALCFEAMLHKFQASSRMDSDSALTESEIAALQRAADGKSAKTIAAETGRSVNTVQTHLKSAYRKLSCSGGKEAVSVARRLGLIH